MKKGFFMLLLAMAVCLSCACGERGVGQNDETSEAGQSGYAPDESGKEAFAPGEPVQGQETPAPEESVQGQETPALEEFVQGQGTPAPEESVQEQETSATEGEKCASSASHFSVCDVAVGDEQITVDYVTDIPKGESNGMGLYLWDEADATGEDLWIDKGVLAAYLSGNEEEPFTFMGLTNGKTYHLYAFVFIDTYQYEGEFELHDIWYIGAYTPSAG